MADTKPVVPIHWCGVFTSLQSPDVVAINISGLTSRRHVVFCTKRAQSCSMSVFVHSALSSRLKPI